ncbi:MAG: hypothetical protein WBD24_00735 [Candidatus Omnitrophota bacterium]
MDVSIFLAKLIGPYLIIVSVGVLLNLEFYRKMVDDFVKNAAVLYIGGVLALFFGLLLVLFHNKWTLSWTLIITIMGWIGILKGVWLIVFPKMMAKISIEYFKKTAVLIVHLAIVFILGVILTVMGFVA